jgi:hypothetical protein
MNQQALLTDTYVVGVMESETCRSSVKLLRNTTTFELLLLAVIAVVALFLSNLFACCSC